MRRFGSYRDLMDAPYHMVQDELVIMEQENAVHEWQQQSAGRGRPGA